MFGIENYPGFIAAAIILNMTPGADTFYILTRSVTFGKKAGFISVAGIMSGCVVHVICAAFGLSLILANSIVIFTIVKWAGAIYLIYLGLKTFFQKDSGFQMTGVIKGGNLIKIYKQGVLTNVLNPKVSLFFLSFLPQFINPDFAKGPLPFLILGGTFFVTGTSWCLVLAWSSTFLNGFLKNHKFTGTLLQKISGLIFIGFGLKLGLDNG